VIGLEGAKGVAATAIKDAIGGSQSGRKPS
jgi:hypothetical protein